MIVRNLREAEGTDRRVVTDNWESTRLLLRDDGMGFSFHITTIYAGTETLIWYQNHLESVYCMEGEGEVEILTVKDRLVEGDSVESGLAETGSEVYPIKPGTIYILNKHDRHLLRAKTEMKLACVFNPPLHGREVHDEKGVYPLETEGITD